MAVKTTKKPRLLVIGPRGLFGCEGGVEKFTDEFVPRTLPHADISVLSLIDPQRVLPEGLEVIHVPRLRWMRTDKALYLLYALKAYALRRYDHVFIFGTNFAILIPLLRTMVWRRAKIHLRSGSVDHLLQKWKGAIGSFLRHTEKFCRWADTVIAVSQGLRDHLKSIGVDAHLIPNGLDFPTDESKAQAPARIQGKVIAVGRVTSAKNYAVLVRAAALLPAEIRAHVTIIGGADVTGEYAMLQEIMAEKQVSNLTFAGAKPRGEVIRHLKEASLYINCSIHEGMSNAILEAIQEGVPMLVSDIESSRSLALPEQLYFDAHNPAQLAEKIAEALKAPASFVPPRDGFKDWESTIECVLKTTGVIA